MNPVLEREIQKLGLSDKEAKVYLAALQLGPQPVQDIARKAGVNRATTYVMIEALTKKGLMASFDRGKKRYFSAEQPDRLLSVLHVQVEELKEREREFSQVLPELRALLSGAAERPRVRFFEGAEGLRSIREEILATDAKELRSVFIARADVNELATPEHEPFDRALVAKGIHVYSIYNGRIAPEEISAHPDWKFVRVSAQQFPFKGEIIVMGSKIFAFTYSGKIIGSIIESADLAETLRTTLRLAWEGAQRLSAADTPPSPPAPAS